MCSGVALTAKLNGELYVEGSSPSPCTKCQGMQVDHVIPINGWSEQGEDTLDNMLPACRSCNHYKSRSTLEGFRKMVENMPTVLMRDSVTYKNAVRFGLVTPTPHPVKFYFEQLGR